MDRKGDTAGRGSAIVFFNVIANMSEIAERQNPSNECASTRIPFINHLADVGVIDELATFGGSKTLIYFAQKPLLVVHHPLHRLH